MTPTPSHRRIDVASETARTRYQLLTSLVVPRPIGWISTFGPDGVSNLAPFSYFAALSASPMYVGVSIGRRRDGWKDTLNNIRERGAFCVNVVTEPQLEAMNATSATVAPNVDEFELAGLERAVSERVDAPYVASCPAVLECTFLKEVELPEARNLLAIAEVVGVLLDPTLPTVQESALVEAEALRPVGRLGGDAYTVTSEVRVVERPR